MSKCVGYVRVSTKSQAENGISLEVQTTKIKAYAELNDYEIIGIFRDEAVSGVGTERENLNQALELACEEKSILISHSLCRLSRSTTQTLEIAERLDKAGANLVSLSEKIDTTSASGKMLFRMMAVLNEFTREQIVEQTSAALQYKKSLGQKTGGSLPYGYLAEERPDDTGKQIKYLIPNEEEQKVLNFIKKLRTEGYSYRRVIEELHQRGMYAREGRLWKLGSLAKLMRNHARMPLITEGENTQQ